MSNRDPDQIFNTNSTRLQQLQQLGNQFHSTSITIKLSYSGITTRNQSSLSNSRRGLSQHDKHTPNFHNPLFLVPKLQTKPKKPKSHKKHKNVLSYYLRRPKYGNENVSEQVGNIVTQTLISKHNFFFK